MRIATDRRTRVVDVVTRPAGVPPAGRDFGGIVVGVCVAFGILLRAFAFARNPGLWGDEAMLALNVVARSPGELFAPLDHNQGAPVGYLLLAKLATLAFGTGEMALRLPSLVAGLAALVVFTRFVFRVLPLTSARFAACLFALSPYVAGYAAEFKQYEVDVAAAAVLLALGRAAWTGGRIFPLAAAGAAAVWVSHPAAFVLGGVAAGVFLNRPRAAVAAAAVWAAAFAANYVLVLRHMAANKYLSDYWAGTFAPLPPAGVGDVSWFVHHFFEAFENPVGLNGPGFGLAGFAGLCFLAGCVELAREDRPLLAATLVPVGLCLAASAVGKYPFAGRLLLFAVPLLLPATARGLALLAAALNAHRPGLGGVAVGVLFVGPVVECGQLLKRPLHREDVRGAAGVLAAAWRPGDRVFVTAGAAAAYEYYARNHAIPPAAVTVGTTDPAGDVARISGPGRVWVVIGHAKSADEAVYRNRLGAAGAVEPAFAGAGCALWKCEVPAAGEPAPAD